MITVALRALFLTGWVLIAAILLAGLGLIERPPWLGGDLLGLQVAAGVMFALVGGHLDSQRIARGPRARTAEGRLFQAYVRQTWDQAIPAQVADSLGARERGEALELLHAIFASRRHQGLSWEEAYRRLTREGFEAIAGAPQRCTYCHDALEAEAAQCCESCGTALHADCWGELAHCPTLGCSAGPRLPGRVAG